MAPAMWRLTVILAAFLVPTLVSPGCVRTAQDRAELDLSVGQATSDDAEFNVADGLAAVHDIDADTLDLWAQAPVLDLTVELDGQAERRWEITVENVMPAAQMTAEGARAGDVSVISRDQTGPTTITWTVEFPADATTQVHIAPPDADQSEPFRFAVLSDVQDEMDDVHVIWERINQDPEVRYVVSAGDLTQNGEMYELVYFMGTLDRLDVPFYTTIGNHEIGPASPEGFHDLYGRVNFNFEFKGVHFSWVDSAGATVDPIAYDWLDDWLEEAKDGTHVFLTHIPPIDPSGIRNGSFRSRNEAAKLLTMLAKGGVDLGLYGHIHSYYAQSNATIPIYISGGGGALPEKFDGIGRHFLTVDYRPGEGIANVGVVRIKHE